MGGAQLPCSQRLWETMREGLKKHQPVTSKTTILENFGTKILGMFTLMDADSSACACGILGLFVPERKKGNLKLLSKYVLGYFNSEDLEGSNDGGSSWYMELHHYLRVSFPKNIMHPLVSNKKSEIIENSLFDSNQFHLERPAFLVILATN